MARQVVADGKPYNQRPAIVWGTEVIVRERALAPHPHPAQKGRLVETRGVTKVLLADGREVFECDVCGTIKDGARSVVSHLPSHNPTVHEPDYPETTIRHVLRLSIRERETGHRGYAERVAEFLNSEGKVKPHKAPQWNAGLVSMIWTRYHDKYAVRLRRATTVAAVRPTSPDVPTTVTTERERSKPTVNDGKAHALSNILIQLDRRTSQLKRDVADLETDLTSLFVEVDKLHKTKTPPPIDPEVVAKARKYDEFMKRMAI